MFFSNSASAAGWAEEPEEMPLTRLDALMKKEKKKKKKKRR
jgi:hypothetical protein